MEIIVLMQLVDKTCQIMYQLLKYVNRAVASPFRLELTHDSNHLIAQFQTKGDINLKLAAAKTATQLWYIGIQDCQLSKLK